MATDDTLYERLGGRPAVELVVDEFYNRVLADEQLQPYFEDTDADELRAHQAAFITQVAGGPDEHDGASMAAAHDHLNVTDTAFARVAEHLDASLRECGVDDTDRAELMDAVASLQPAVVTA